MPLKKYIILDLIDHAFSIFSYFILDEFFIVSFWWTRMWFLFDLDLSFFWAMSFLWWAFHLKSFLSQFLLSFFDKVMGLALFWRMTLTGKLKKVIDKINKISDFFAFIHSEIDLSLIYQQIKVSFKKIHVSILLLYKHVWQFAYVNSNTSCILVQKLNLWIPVINKWWSFCKFITQQNHQQV